MIHAHFRKRRWASGGRPSEKENASLFSLILYHYDDNSIDCVCPLCEDRRLTGYPLPTQAAGLDDAATAQGILNNESDSKCCRSSSFRMTLAAWKRSSCSSLAIQNFVLIRVTRSASCSSSEFPAYIRCRSETWRTSQ